MRGALVKMKKSDNIYEFFSQMGRTFGTKQKVAEEFKDKLTGSVLC